MYARRRKRYFVLMTTCLVLFISAWAFVRLLSVPAAIGMCLVAMVIPPIAAIAGNRREPDDRWFDEPDDRRFDKPEHRRSDEPEEARRPADTRTAGRAGGSSRERRGPLRRRSARDGRHTR